MKKFIKHISLYFSIILLFSLTLELKITKNINTKGNRYYVQFDWFDSKNHNSDILALGNSRTWVHLSPFIISNSTGYSSEIIAAEGQGPMIVYYKLLNYLNNNTLPKVILLQFDPHFLNQGDELYGSKNWSPGYFLNRLSLGQMKKLKGYKEYYSFMPLWGIDIETRLKILNNDKCGGDSIFKFSRGYFPNNQEWEGDLLTSKCVELNGRDKFYDSIITLASNNQISVVLVTPPYSPILNANSLNFYNNISNYYDEINRKYSNKLFWIYLNDSNIFNDQQYFYNHLHLNKKGSIIYSKLLAQKLKYILNAL